MSSTKRLEKEYKALIFFIFAVFLFYVSIIVDKPVYIIAAGFLPAITTYLIASSAMRTKYFDAAWASALLLPLALTLTQPLPLYNTMDIKALIIDNILISLAIVILLTLGNPGKKTGNNAEEKKKKTQEYAKLTNTGLKPEKPKPIIMEKRTIVKEKEPEKKTQIEVKAKSMEEKCKALNAAIGRVYRKTRGGSKNLRKLIKVSPGTYNAFSALLEAEKLDSKQATTVLTEIMKKLETIEQTESQVFGSAHKLLRKLNRDEKGDDPVIDVLEKNDSDPVRTYLTEAKETCYELINSISK